MFVTGQESGLRWVWLNDECIADSMKNRSYLAFLGQRHERLSGEEKAINCGCKSHEVNEKLQQYQWSCYL